jgi:hypothetical protein
MIPTLPRVPTLLALAALACAPGARLTAEEQLKLASGDIVTGELVKETATAVDLRRKLLVKHMVKVSITSIPKDQITSRSKVPDAPELYKTRSAGVGDSMEEQCALARWCIEHVLVDQAVVHTGKAADAAPDSPLVAKLYTDLGFVKTPDGKWAKEDEYLAQTGQVDLGGKIMSPAEAEARKTLYRANAEDVAAAQQVKDLQFVVDHYAERITDTQKKLDTAKSTQSEAQARAKSAQAQAEAAAKRAANNKGQNGNGNGYGTNGRRGGQQQQQAQTAGDPAAEYAQASTDAETATRDVTTLTRRLASLQQTLDKAKADLPAAKERLTKADADLDKAKAGVPGADKSDKPADAGTVAKTPGEAPGKTAAAK